VCLCGTALLVDLSNKVAAALVHLQEGGGLLSAGRLCIQCSVQSRQVFAPVPASLLSAVLCWSVRLKRKVQVLSMGVALE
jgi:hypothetical protein